MGVGVEGLRLVYEKYWGSLSLSLSLSLLLLLLLLSLLPCSRVILGESSRAMGGGGREGLIMSVITIGAIECSCLCLFIGCLYPCPKFATV